jgi:hypothetical protein
MEETTNGVVVGNNGQPIGNAVITFKDPKTQKVITSTTADTTGRYTVSLPSGNYSITISEKDLNMTRTFTETLSSNGIKNFTLATTNKSLIVPKRIIPGVPLDTFQLVLVGIGACLLISLFVLLVKRR